MKENLRTAEKLVKISISVGVILVLAAFTLTSTGCFEPTMKFVKEFGTEGKDTNQFNGPTDIVVNSKGEVFICDTNNNRIVRYDNEGENPKVFGSVILKQPMGICVDKTDQVFVADTGNNRVVKFTPDGRFLTEIYSTVKLGQQKEAANSLKMPYDVAVTSNNTIYIVDVLNRIIVFDSLGVCKNKLGSKGSGSTEFDVPTRIAVTDDDIYYNIFVADSFNSRIIKFNIEYKSIFETKDKGMFQYLRDPRGLAVLPDKSIIVSDCGSMPLCAYNSQGVFEGSGGSFGLGRGRIISAGGLAVDVVHKKLFVSDQLQHKVLIFRLHKENIAKVKEEAK